MALALGERMKRSWYLVPKKRIKITVALVLLVMILILGREQGVSLIGNHLIVEDDRKPADVIHVIAGDDYRADDAI